jgi:hypothetical protein
VWKVTAANKQFGEIGGEVIVRISVILLTVGDCPNCVQLSPNFAKPPGRYLQAKRTQRQRTILQKKKNKIIIYQKESVPLRF